MRKIAPQNEYLGLYHATREMPIEGTLSDLITRRVPLGAKPWRMSVLLSYLAHLDMDRWLPQSDIFHGTDHLLPPLKNSRGVFTIHDLIFRFFPEYHLPLNRWFLDLMLPKFMQRADAVIAVSENTRRDVARLMDIPAEKMTVIYEGVHSNFRPVQDKRTRERVRVTYNLPPRYLLFFSTIEPRKNVITLLDAYAELLRRGEDVPPLVVMGRKGWLYRATLKRIQDLGLTPRVMLTDWVESTDVPTILSMADVFVFPSLYEGFGLTPLEAMACGAPVISSNASSLPEVIGDAGILLEPRDVQGFADAISRVLRDDALRVDLQARGLRRAKLFTWERAARETLATYERVSGKK
jgi:glycosyltransferase involved in cell wall biosynthesis